MIHRVCNRSPGVAVSCSDSKLSLMKNRFLFTTAIAAVSLLGAYSMHAQDAKPKGGKAAAAFAAADKDGDGKLNAAEFAAMNKGKLDAAAAKAKFEATDTDKDGFVTREELRAEMRSHAGKKPAN